MKTLAVTATIDIDQPVEVVRQQFGDLAHHARSGVHRGVRFTVIDDDGTLCRYRQATRVGPIWLRQELVVQRVDDGPLVNEITHIAAR